MAMITERRDDMGYKNPPLKTEGGAPAKPKADSSGKTGPRNDSGKCEGAIANKTQRKSPRAARKGRERALGYKLATKVRFRG
jgi:hypothetical protein